ncbi:MAG: filamentous hemagglutinin N-terminal domain-containing protein [Deltaproteobacteria bacterium]|jgi:filamentous hemagglutinin family protein|nr:filamentous hemagglutinin N-terminal domain-containing protein [Deltaproteobacteria bacterium]
MTSLQNRFLGVAIHLVIFVLIFQPSLALAGPEGGQVVAGQASIAKSGAETNIRQSSDLAVINWNSFDIGKGETVDHRMPGPNSTGLHRVVGGGGASQLEGALKSNGNVFLVNPKGTVIHNGARIDTKGFVATTSDIKNEDFMAGNLDFGIKGSPGAAIINKGEISVRENGYAALVAPQVRNEGIIAGRLSSVALASADRFKLDVYGDDLISFAVDDETAGEFYDTSGEQLGAENVGRIENEGGIVLLTAKQLDQTVAGTVNNSGLIEAGSADFDGGKIVLRGVGERVKVTSKGTISGSSVKADGGVVRVVGEGAVEVSGSIEAKGGRKGGAVDISGKKETSLAAAQISAEGSDGGLVRLGGSFQGGEIKPNMPEDYRDNFLSNGALTDNLYNTLLLNIDQSSVINSGVKGTAIAWSDGVANIDGIIKGKYIETSGKKLNIASPPEIFGNGMWLIDPEDVIVSDQCSGNTWDSTCINSNWLTQAANDYGVSIFGENSLTINSSLNFELSNQNIGTFYLYGGNSLIINDNISIIRNYTYDNIYLQLNLNSNNIVIGDYITIEVPEIVIKADNKFYAGNNLYISAINWLFISASDIEIRENAFIRAGRLDIDASRVNAAEDIYYRTKKLFIGLNSIIESNNIGIIAKDVIVPGLTIKDDIEDYTYTRDVVVFYDTELFSGHLKIEREDDNTNNIFFNRTYDSPVIKLILEGGSIDNPVIEAKTVTLDDNNEFLDGNNIFLDEYSLKVDLFFYNDKNTIIGTNSDGAPHIYNLVNGSCPNWPFDTVILQYKDDTDLPYSISISDNITSGITSFSFDNDGKINYIAPTNDININVDDLISALTSSANLSFLITSTGNLILDAPLVIESSMGLGFNSFGDIFFNRPIALKDGNLLAVSSTGDINVNGGLILENGVFALEAEEGAVSINNAIYYSVTGQIEPYSLINAKTVNIDPDVAIKGVNKDLRVSAGERVNIGPNSSIDISPYSIDGPVLRIESARYLDLGLGSKIHGSQIQLSSPVINIFGSKVTAAENLLISATDMNLKGVNLDKTILNGQFISLFADNIIIDAAELISSGDINITGDNLNIKAESVLMAEEMFRATFSDTLNLYGGTIYQPNIQAPYVRIYGYGSYSAAELGPYSIKAEEFDYGTGSNKVLLVGKQSGNNWQPHVFGLKPASFSYSGSDLLYKGLKSADWPFTTILLSDSQGTLWPSKNDDQPPAIIDTNPDSGLPEYNDDQPPSVIDTNPDSGLPEYDDDQPPLITDTNPDSDKPKVAAGSSDYLYLDKSLFNSQIEDETGKIIYGPGATTSNPKINPILLNPAEQYIVDTANDLAGKIYSELKDNLNISLDFDESVVDNALFSMLKSTIAGFNELFISLGSNNLPFLDIFKDNNILNFMQSELFIEKLKEACTKDGIKKLGVDLATKLIFDAIRDTIIETLGWSPDQPTFWASWGNEILIYSINVFTSSAQVGVSDYIKTGKLPGWDTVVRGSADAVFDEISKLIELRAEYSKTISQLGESFSAYFGGYVQEIIILDNPNPTGPFAEGTEAREHLKNVVENGLIVNEQVTRALGLGGGHTDPVANATFLKGVSNTLEMIAELIAAKKQGDDTKVMAYEYMITKTVNQSWGAFPMDVVSHFCANYGVIFNPRNDYPFPLGDGEKPPAGQWLKDTVDKRETATRQTGYNPKH